MDEDIILIDGLIDNQLLASTKATMDKLLSYGDVQSINAEGKPKRISGDLIALYHFYAYTAKWQETYLIKCSTGYVENALGWSNERVVRAKKALIELGLITDEKKQMPDNSVLYLIKFRYYISGNKQTDPSPRKFGDTPTPKIRGIPPPENSGTNTNSNNTEEYTYSNNTQEVKDAPIGACVIDNNSLLNKSLPLQAKACAAAADEPTDAEKIYAAYPRKIDKIKAIIKIKQALKLIPFNELMPLVERYAELVRMDLDSGKTEMRYIPYPATWFNKERWTELINEDVSESEQQPQLWL